MVARVQSLPGVKNGCVDELFAAQPRFIMEMVYLSKGQPPSRGARIPEAMKCSISTEYFSTMVIPIVAGRGFTSDDKSDSPLGGNCQRNLRVAFLAGSKRYRQAIREQRRGPLISRRWNCQRQQIFQFERRTQGFFFTARFARSYHGEAVLVVRTAAEPGLMMSAVKREVKQLDAHCSCL